MTARICQRCKVKPVSRKPHSIFCDACTEAIYNPTPEQRQAAGLGEDEADDLFARIRRNHEPLPGSSLRAQP